MGSVFLADLDADMIGLGAECTNPVFVAKPAKKGRVHLSMEDDGVMRDMGSGRATVTVSDCLACSGCVTSAETVLLSRDSTAEFQALPESCAVCVSQASLASLAEGAGASPARTLAALRRAWSPRIVVHAASAHDLALLEVVDEFLARARCQRRKAQTPEPSAAVSDVVARDAKGRETVLGPAERRDDGPLPLLVSECPGVVCFVEKTAPHALPYLSSAKSGMAVFGAVAPRQYGVSAVVAVVPCADKKLEAARRDLSTDRRHHVDVALTTTEALAVVGGLDALKGHVAACCDDDEAFVAAPDGAGSGGYLDFAYRAASLALTGETAPDRLPYKRVRNDDFHELCLSLPDGSSLRFARAYGFRNVQRVAGMLKKQNCPYDFVEVMACPVSRELLSRRLCVDLCCLGRPSDARHTNRLAAPRRSRGALSRRPSSRIDTLRAGRVRQRRRPASRRRCCVLAGRDGKVRHFFQCPNRLCADESSA